MDFIGEMVELGQLGSPNISGLELKSFDQVVRIQSDEPM